MQNDVTWKSDMVPTEVRPQDSRDWTIMGTVSPGFLFM